MQLCPLFAIALALLAVRLESHAASPDISTNATPSSVAIVELFTSEGCSSCPPADALLRQINLKQTNAGQLIVGISEHVTYWNNLGWKDPYSSPVFTDRQSVYASRLSSEGSPGEIQAPKSADDILAPLLYPNKLIMLGANYLDHMHEDAGYVDFDKASKIPCLFMKPPTTAIVGSGASRATGKSEGTY